MKSSSLRLSQLWQMIPGNHNIVLRVKSEDGQSYYTDGYYRKAVESCPYYRQFAFVLSVYAITTEIIEITINENMPKKNNMPNERR